VASYPLLPGTNGPTVDETDLAIRWLGETQPLTEFQFGLKAARLHQVAKTFGHVPPGFCIGGNFVRRLASGDLKIADRATLEAAYTKLTAQCGKQSRFIVRSSYCQEDAEGSLFSGIFKSISGVSCWDELLIAIGECYHAFEHPDIQSYFEHRGMRRDIDGLGLIIQEQQVAQWSGVILLTHNGWTCEYDKGDLAPSITGRALPSVLECQHGRVWPVHLRDAGHERGIEDIRRAAEELRESCPSLFPVGAVIEFGVVQGEVRVYQHRPAGHLFDTHDTSSGLSERTRLRLPGRSTLGAKAAATRYFLEKRLFAKSIAVFERDELIETIESRLSQIPFSARGVTIRFSHGFDLGLPRAFVQTYDEAIRFIRSTRQRDWATIVHDYIDVQSSYEAMISKEGFSLEHVPGMWESESESQPDFVSVSYDRVEVWRCSRPRPTRRIDLPSQTDKAEVVGPVALAQVKEWVYRMVPIAAGVRADLWDQLPVNVHFVEEANGDWQFLNMRGGFDIPMPRRYIGAVHTVANSRDLARWNKKDPLLLRVSTQRGNERTLLDLAQLIPKHGVDVYIDFGVLSHPAMVLREYGLRLLPSYSLTRLNTGFSSYLEDCWNI
jgi:hypothetical protein